MTPPEAAPGRNDPCPCGSGLKYKKCHLAQDAADAATLDWQRLRQVIDPAPAAMLRYAIAEHGGDVVDEAWWDFSGSDDEIFDGDTLHTPIFLAWFLHHWRPDPADTVVPEEAFERFPVAADYIRERGTRADPLLARYVEAASAAPLSFHAVVTAEPGTGFTLHDLMTGRTVEVMEKAASAQVPPGNILFAQVVQLGAVTVLGGCAPLSFPAVERPGLLELRHFLAGEAASVDPARLVAASAELTRVYTAVAAHLQAPSRDTFRNSDGELLAYCRVTYSVPSAEAALAALRPMTQGAGDDAGEAEWLRDGNRRHPEWPFTVLGVIRAEGERLVAEVDSEERAARFRALADELLPAGSAHLGTEIESAEALLAAAEAGDTADAGIVEA